jgi:hypothetical protein
MIIYRSSREYSVGARLAEAGRRDRLVVIALGNEGEGTLDGQERRSCRDRSRKLGSLGGTTTHIHASLNELTLVERASHIRRQVLRLDLVDALQAVAWQSMGVEVKHELVLPDLQLLGGGGQQGLDWVDPHVL